MIVNGTKDPVHALGTFFWSAITHRTAGRSCPARGGGIRRRWQFATANDQTATVIFLALSLAGAKFT